MMDRRPWEELSKEIEKLSEEYAKLKNKPKSYETGPEREAREDQIRKDRDEKWEQYESLKADFEKKRDYIRNLRKEVETMRVMERKDELEQKLKNGNIEEKELLELQAINNLQKTS